VKCVVTYLKICCTLQPVLLLCVGLYSDDESLTDVDDKSLATHSVMPWDLLSKSSPADSSSTVTSKHCHVVLMSTYCLSHVMLLSSSYVHTLPC